MSQTAVFDRYSQFYDVFYNQKNYWQEADYVAALIDKYHPFARTILELGCGTGNHANFFSKIGFSIAGIDQSNEMIVIAKEKKIKDFDPIVADIRSFQLANKKFDVALALFHVISYLALNKDLTACFQCVNKHLHIGGLFIFDVWYTPAIYHQQPQTTHLNRTVGSLDIHRLAEPLHIVNENSVEVNYSIRISNKVTHEVELITEKHIMRHFSIPEIELLAGGMGFQLVSVQELLTGSVPGINTWGVCFIVKKISELHTS